MFFWTVSIHAQFAMKLEVWVSHVRAHVRLDGPVEHLNRPVPADTAAEMCARRDGPDGVVQGIEVGHKPHPPKDPHDGHADVLRLVRGVRALKH